MKLEKEVKLLTYNVFLRPPPIKTNEDDFKQERFSEIMKLVHEYDILCFEQMFQTGSFRAERIIEYAIDHKFEYWRMSQPPLFTPGSVVDSGLLVISKYPILHSHFQSYGIGILSDSASDKGYIYCKIQIKTSILHLFVTHLQASYMVPGGNFERELSVKARQAQISILMNRIQQHLKANDYTAKDLVMLVGDLNINSKQQPYRLNPNSPLEQDNQMSSKRPALRSNRVQLNSERDNQQCFSEFLAFQQQIVRRNFGLTDHMVQDNNEHQVTFGDNQQLLTDHGESRSFQRLDYIFTLRPNNVIGSTLRPVKGSCKVEQFKKPGSKYGQLSDHYGVSISIQ